MNVTPETKPFASSVDAPSLHSHPHFGTTSDVVPCSAFVPAGQLGSCPKLRPELALAMLPLINQRRASVGSRPLVIDARLQACAEWKAKSCGGYLYLDHDDHGSIERTWFTRMGVYYPVGRAACGENIAYGHLTAASVMDAFLSDIGHRQNVESASWAAVGLAVAESSSGLLFWIQDFGSDVVAPAPSPDPDPTPVPDPPPPTPGKPLIERGWRYRNTTSGVVIEILADVPADAAPTWPVSYRNVKNNRHGSLRLKLFKQRYARV